MPGILAGEGHEVQHVPAGILRCDRWLWPGKDAEGLESVCLRGWWPRSAEEGLSVITTDVKVLHLGLRHRLGRVNPSAGDQTSCPRFRVHCSTAHLFLFKLTGGFV